MPRVKLFNEDEVLHKAMDLFWEKGYFDTSVGDMVDRLGINRGSMYTTFGNKKSMFDQSLSLYCKINEDATLKFLESQKSVKEGIKNVFERFIDTSVNDINHKGCLVVNTTTEIGSSDKDVEKILLKHKKKIEDIFYQFLLKGQESGEISMEKDIKAISFLIYTLFNGIRVVSKLEKNSQNLLATLNTVLSLLD